MGPSALSSPLANLASVASPKVYARRGTEWIDGGSAFGFDVRALAAALVGYGLSPGVCAAVLGSEGCETLRAELSVLVAGGTLVSLDPALTDGALSQALSSNGVVQAIASDEAQLARILALRPDLPALELVLLMKAEPSERKPAALLASTAVQVGAAALSAEPSMLEKARTAGDGKRAMVIVPTSRGAQSVDRSALQSLAQSIAQSLGAAPGRTVLLALPRGSVARLAAAMTITGQGATLLLADPSGSADSGLMEHPVDAALLSPQALERLHHQWQAELDRRTWPARAIARWSLRQGMESGAARWKRGLADWMTLRDLRARLGGRLRSLEVDRGEASAVDIAGKAFFEAIGLPVIYLK